MPSMPKSRIRISSCKAYDLERRQAATSKSGAAAQNSRSWRAFGTLRGGGRDDRRITWSESVPRGHAQVAFSGVDGASHCCLGVMRSGFAFDAFQHHQQASSSPKTVAHSTSGDDGRSGPVRRCYALSGLRFADMWPCFAS
jgi:hypothetical protein